MIRPIEETSGTRSYLLFVSSFSLLLLLLGCGKKEKTALPTRQATSFDVASIELEDPDLIAGRETWMKTCSTCHQTGLTGAPKIGDTSAWAPRISKGLDTLYNHALNGFIGPEYTEMPPKGGFRDLSDAEVKQAVRFMTHVSQ